MCPFEIAHNLVLAKDVFAYRYKQTPRKADLQRLLFHSVDRVGDHCNTMMLHLANGFMHNRFRTHARSKTTAFQKYRIATKLRLPLPPASRVVGAVMKLTPRGGGVPGIATPRYLDVPHRTARNACRHLLRLRRGYIEHVVILKVLPSVRGSVVWVGVCIDRHTARELELSPLPRGNSVACIMRVGGGVVSINRHMRERVHTHRVHIRLTPYADGYRCEFDVPADDGYVYMKQHAMLSGWDRVHDVQHDGVPRIYSDNHWTQSRRYMPVAT